MTAVERALHLNKNGAQPQDARRWLWYQTDGGQGVLAPGQMAVTQADPSVGMSVDVSDGAAVIIGTDYSEQGSYAVENRGADNLTLAASDPTNPRHDLIIAQVLDDQLTKVGSKFRLHVVQGAAEADPSDPQLPSNSLLLGRVRVGAGASQIIDDDIDQLTPVIDTGGPKIVASVEWNTAVNMSGAPLVIPVTLNFEARADRSYQAFLKTGTWEPSTATSGLLSFRFTGSISEELGATWVSDDQPIEATHVTLLSGISGAQSLGLTATAGLSANFTSTTGSPLKCWIVEMAAA